MKFLQLLLLLSLLASATFGQSDFSHFNEIIPEIKGQLIGYDAEKDEDLSLKFTCLVPTYEYQRTYYVDPNADGSFEFKMPYPLRYQQVFFSINEFFLRL